MSVQYEARKRAIVLSVLVGLVMLVTKMTAYWLTGSTAILSDALESVVHVVATSFALYSVVNSAQPPDRLHPYGHGKVEFFSAGFEGALIVLAGIVIVYASGRRLLVGGQPQKLDVGILLTLFAGVVNFVLGLFLIRSGRRTGSLTLVADGKHVLTDSYTSLGVVIGLVLVRVTGLIVLDPLVAMAVAANIMIMGARLMHVSVSGLLDEADEDALQSIVSAIRGDVRPEWIDVHHLRSWSAGERRIVDLHLTVPRYWEVERAYGSQCEVEKTVLDALPGGGEVIVHLDPCEPGCCCFCDVANCAVRADAKSIEHPWSLEQLLGDPGHSTLSAQVRLDAGTAP